MINLKNVPIEKSKDLEWLDYSTLKTFMHCPRAYYWQSLKHIKTEGAALLFGSAVHASLASWFERMDRNAAFEAFSEIAKLITQEDPKRNLTTGLDILDHYMTYWEGEQYVTTKTDVPFAIELNTISDRPFLYVGKIDRMITSPILGGGIMEHKTSSIAGDRWMSRVEPNLQMEGYAAAASIVSGEPTFGVLDIIHVHEKRTARKFQRVIKTKQNIEDWAMNVSWWMEQIRFFNGVNFHPKATEHCVPLIGYSCSFHTLCNLYPNPYEVTELTIPGEYKIEQWHPFDALKEKK